MPFSLFVGDLGGHGWSMDAPDEEQADDPIPSTSRERNFTNVSVVSDNKVRVSSRHSPHISRAIQFI